MKVTGTPRVIEFETAEPPPFDYERTFVIGLFGRTFHAHLLTRAADVTLKERRPLVLMVRETPLHLGHLRTMVKLTEMGAIIAPPLPAFYAQPQTLAQVVDQSVGRALDLFGLSWGAVRRWGEDLDAIPRDPAP